MTALQTRQIDKTAMRDSGIELLKIIAIFLIVISHVVQTLASKNDAISFSDYVVDLSVASTNMKYFLITLFYYFGKLGNTIFFICSAWFLLRSSKYNKRKWFFMLFEVWIISLIILVITEFITHGNIAMKPLIKSIFPTTFSSNWYITCYLLFYPVHPLLNSVINKMDKKSLLRSSIVLFVLYFGFAFIKSDLLQCNDLLRWLAIYFIMAYLQNYLKDFMNNTKQNVILLLVGIAGFIGIAFFANVLGLKVSFLNDKVLHWNSNSHPFILAISIALFNLMRKGNYKSVVINYISSLSLLIYVIHENIILKTYFRPKMWNYVYNTFGYSHIVLWVFVLSSIVFAFGIIASMIYDKTLRSIIRKLSNKIYEWLIRIYLKLENRMINNDNPIK